MKLPRMLSLLLTKLLPRRQYLPFNPYQGLERVSELYRWKTCSFKFVELVEEDAVVVLDSKDKEIMPLALIPRRSARKKFLSMVVPSLR